MRRKKVRSGRPMLGAADERKAGTGMGISRKDLEKSLNALGRIEPAFAAALARVGVPEPRTGEHGYVTLLRAIVGQQVSVASATAIWNRVETAMGGAADPANMARTSD